MLKKSLPMLSRIAMMLVVTTGVAASLAHAELTPIIDFTGGGAFGVIGGANATSGFTFSVTTATTIAGLGIFDVGADGLINSHQVGLWTSGGTLLASATLDNSANVVASTSNLGHWLETDIAPLVLDPGSYVLGASYLDAQTNSEDDAGFFANASSVPGVGYGNTVIETSSNFGFPNFNEPSLDAGSFGPMAFTGAGAVPEPESLGLSICALAFCGLAFRTRLRTSAGDAPRK